MTHGLLPGEPFGWEPGRGAPRAYLPSRRATRALEADKRGVDCTWSLVSAIPTERGEVVSKGRSHWCSRMVMLRQTQMGGGGGWGDPGETLTLCLSIFPLFFSSHFQGD